MEEFLICENPKCLFLVDLRTKDNQMLTRSDLPLTGCPECGHAWSSKCPFCSRTLEVIWRDQLPHCFRCLRKLVAPPPETTDAPGDS